MSRKRNRYLVGFDQDNQTVYGKSETLGEFRWADPMTLTQARLKLRELGRSPVPKCVYKLVPVREPKR